MKKIGVFGGAFNPIHAGHLYIAQEAIKAVDLEEVWFVPTGNHPNKGIVGAKDRIKLIKESLKISPKFKLNLYETRTKGICWTCKTLFHFDEWYGAVGAKFVLVLGSDQATMFKKWKDYKAILNWFEIVIIARKGYKVPEYLYNLGNINVVYPDERINISSSMIRKMYKEEV